MPKTSAAAKQARQEQILGAAVRCFARKGYYATTIEDLVAETCLSRGALYLYFPNKEALYLALADRWNCGLEEAVQRRVTPGLSPGAVLQLVIEVTGAQVEADDEACRVLMEGWTLGHMIPALGEQVRRQQERAQQVFSSCSRQASPAGNSVLTCLSPACADAHRTAPRAHGGVAPAPRNGQLAARSGGNHARPPQVRDVAPRRTTCCAPSHGRRSAHLPFPSAKERRAERRIPNDMKGNMPPCQHPKRVNPPSIRLLHVFLPETWSKR